MLIVANVSGSSFKRKFKSFQFNEMGLVTQLNSPFPYYLNDDRKNLFLSGAVGLFVLFFMTFYKTHNSIILDLTLWHKLMFGGITFSVMAFNIVVLPKFFTGILDTTQWTVLKYMLHVLWICTMIALINTTIEKIFICPELPTLSILWHVCTQIVLTGIIPITVMSLLFRNNLLQENLKSATGANQQIDKILHLKKEPRANHTVTLHSDTTETLTINLPDLLFIEADDNYATVVWKNGHGIEKKLLRVNLKNLENQLNNTFTMRCHRSYIVNVHAVAAINGNANGYKLQIRDSDYSIPVSRQKGKELMEKISQLRDMMESY